ncbi:MAG: hypothetical protein SO129_07895, partial [Anaerovibrio sp.]|nr:hypothetical protein [Anaerovibrio sp.]
KSLIPTSMPISPPLLGKISTSSSTHRETKYLPVALRDTVTFKILPVNFLESFIFTRPILGSVSLPFLIAILLLTYWER